MPGRSCEQDPQSGHVLLTLLQVAMRRLQYRISGSLTECLFDFGTCSRTISFVELLLELFRGALPELNVIQLTLSSGVVKMGFIRIKALCIRFRSLHKDISREVLSPRSHNNMET